MRRAAIAAAVLGLAGRALLAQGDCFPSRDSHEAKTFAVMSLPLAFSAVEAPLRVSRTSVRIGLEGASIPSPDSITRTPTVCRPGKGPERTDLLFALPRPRLSVMLPGGLGFEASWIPPLAINGVKANLLGFALSETVRLGARGMLLAVRAHGTIGVVHAPITCNTGDLSDPASECFEGTRSNDRYHPNIFGADAALGWSLAGGRLRPYVGGGYNILHPRFQVNFTNSQGSTDNRKIEVDLGRVVAFGGLSWVPAPAWELSGEIYTAPGDAVTGRLAVRRALIQ